MVELMVALAISMIIVVGSLILLRYMITVADDNRDKTLASLEVQYVGFWISEDVVQAQTVELGSYHGFPLKITWTEWDEEDTEIMNEVIYEVGNVTDMFGNDLWRLYRTHSVDGASLGTSLVGQYLERDSTECIESEHEFVSSLILRVAAKVDRSTGNNTYEIHPRAFCLWLPE
jgi:hypothetical protein